MWFPEVKLLGQSLGAKRGGGGMGMGYEHTGSGGGVSSHLALAE